MTFSSFIRPYHLPFSLCALFKEAAHEVQILLNHTGPLRKRNNASNVRKSFTSPIFVFLTLNASVVTKIMNILLASIQTLLKLKTTPNLRVLTAQKSTQPPKEAAKFFNLKIRKNRTQMQCKIKINQPNMNSLKIKLKP